LIGNNCGIIQIEEEAFIKLIDGITQNLNGDSFGCFTGGKGNCTIGGGVSVI
jgi:hypothetical protein